MNGFFDYSSNRIVGIGFGHFGPGHLAWLFFGGLFLVLGCGLYQHQPKKRRTLALIVASLGLVLELGRAALLMSQGLYGRGRLPLHLCTLSVYLCFIHAIFPNPVLGQFLYAFTLPGAALALLFPDWADYPAWHFVSLSSFLLHLLLVLYPLMLTVTGDIRPDIRRLPGCIGLMLCLALPVYQFNLIFDTNYMFLNWPLRDSPLEYFAFLGRPGYLLGFIPIASLVWTLLYAREAWKLWKG